MKELLYRKITDSIREKIETGEYPEGYRLSGVRDLSNEWMTSSNTILKALSMLESDGYLKKVQGSGIFVQKSEDWVSSKESPLGIEFILYSLDVPFNSSLSSAVEKAAGSFGYKLSIKTEENINRLSLPGDIPAIVVPRSAEDCEELLSVKRETPFIFVGEFNPPVNFQANFAVADSYGGFFKAAEYLISQERERIAYIGAGKRIEEEPGWNACRDVMSGTRYGFGRKYSVSAGGWDTEKGSLAAEKLLLDGEYPDSIICCNDAIAAGALKACRAAGLTVSDDIFIIGCGDQELTAFLEPPLTSLRMPVEEIAFAAVGYIDNIVKKRISPKSSFRARFDMELIIREASSEDSASSDDTKVDELYWV